MRARAPLWGLAAAFALQAALLAWIVVDRALLLANGKEVRLAVVPVDPRDLFRGDYVILSYAVSRLAAAELDGDDEFDFAAPIFVSLRQEAGGWKPVSIHRERPKEGVVLKGRISDENAGGSDCRAPCRIYSVEYGLEQFFVPEGQGLALERLRNDQRMEVDVAVASNGRAALKRLLVDGEIRYAERLF